MQVFCLLPVGPCLLGLRLRSSDSALNWLLTHPLNVTRSLPHLESSPFLSILTCLVFQDFGIFSREILTVLIVPVLSFLVMSRNTLRWSQLTGIYCKEARNGLSSWTGLSSLSTVVLESRLESRLCVAVARTAKSRSSLLSPCLTAPLH